MIQNMNEWKIIKKDEKEIKEIPDDLISLAEATRVLEKRSRATTKLSMFWHGVPFYKSPYSDYQGSYMVSRADVEKLKAVVLTE